MSASSNVPFSSRAHDWKLRTRTLSFPRRPLVMGIVNVTPDSFSDGGKCLDTDRAIEHALQLVRDGADLLDIGGESTRPYSTPVSADEELRRVLPVVTEVCRRVNIPLSIDTSKSAVARPCLDAGAEIINDVTGLGDDRRLKHVVREYHAGVCVMHMQGTPQTMQDDPQYDDVVREVHEFLKSRRDVLSEFGINPASLCLDPGIGFGKTHQHNLTLMANCWRFHELGCPLLVGHSRKGFIAKLLGAKDADRTAGTIGAACSLARQGIQIIRVHDVRAVREALLLFEATGGIDGQPLQLL
jgi:dihydropteroate synthase